MHYENKPEAEWLEITKALIAGHPLTADVIREIVLNSWNDIFKSRIGSPGYKIGKNIFPRPQIMAFLLHELIPLELARRYPGVWRADESAGEKDLHYVPDPQFSIELKTSSSVRDIYGNRSFAQEGAKSKKEKSGYYLAINFGKFITGGGLPRITRIRFGWLDRSDWMGQDKPTGQQASLSRAVKASKFIDIPVD